MSDYQLSIDEKTSTVDFSTQSLSGAKSGLLELKRQKKIYYIKKREAIASVREERVMYRGHQAIGKFRVPKKDLAGTIVAAISNFIISMRKAKKYEAMANSEFSVSSIDRVIASIDKAILELEDEIAKNSQKQ